MSTSEEKSDLTGPALDITYEDIEVDFGMSIYSQVEEIETASLQFALFSSNWTFQIGLWEVVQNNEPRIFHFEGAIS